MLLSVVVKFITTMNNETVSMTMKMKSTMKSSTLENKHCENESRNYRDNVVSPITSK